MTRPLRTEGMFVMTKLYLPVLILMVILPQAALADPAASPSKNTKAADPNEMVCEYQEVLGSRLASHKVCATRAEWRDRQLQERMQVDKTQLNTSHPTG